MKDCDEEGYNYGWQDRTNQIRSVMSEECTSNSCDGEATGTCNRVLHFSTPTHPYNNTIPIGDADHNNAKYINDNLELVACRLEGWNCTADSSCIYQGEQGTCDTSTNRCLFPSSHGNTDGPVSIAWMASDVLNTQPGIYSQFSLDIVVPSKTADENYNGPDVYGALDRADQGSWNIGNGEASGLRVRFEEAHAGESVAGLFLLKTDSVAFTSASNTLSAPDIFISQVQRLSSATMRFVIEDGGQFYISSESPNFAAESGTTGHYFDSFALQALSTDWFFYDPKTSPNSVSAIGVPATPAFRDIGFVGFTLFATSAADLLVTSVNFGVQKLLVSAETLVSPDVSSLPPTSLPSVSRSASSSDSPSAAPSTSPSMTPSTIPSIAYSTSPSTAPSSSPSAMHNTTTSSPSIANTSIAPSKLPSSAPSVIHNRTKRVGNNGPASSSEIPELHSGAFSQSDSSMTVGLITMCLAVLSIG